MNADLIAFSVLGLRPGANAAEVEAAYRQLIKTHHPDRAGGDAERAAEINWAYHHLRKARQLPMTRLSNYPVVQPMRGASGSRGSWFGLALAAVAIVILFNVGAIGRALDSLQFAWSRSNDGLRPASPNELNELEQPLMSEVIDRSALLAAELAGTGDTERLVERSRHCHGQLRRDPELARLDQCVAFDEAAALLLEGAQADRQFSASAVTGRQLSAARLFPGGYEIVESRLDRIRARVAFTLAPADPQPAPPIEF